MSAAKKKPAAKKRGPGRPRVGEGETVSLRTRVPAAVAAELEREATRRGVTVSDIVRERIAGVR